MNQCDHTEFDAIIDVARLTNDDGDICGYAAEITITCRPCREPFTWIGLPVGLLPTAPTTDLLARTLYAPIEPAGGPPNDLNRPGFTLRMWDTQ